MNPKEASRPQITESIMREGDISFLKYILPTKTFEVEIIKKEGDYLDQSDLRSKLPKGYALVKILSDCAFSLDGFGVDINNARDETKNLNTIPSSFCTAFSRFYGQDLPGYEIKIPHFKNPNETQAREESCDWAKQTKKEQIQSKSQLTKNKDSLGYFKALNLDSRQLAILSQEDLKKEIKTHYRQAANLAHPDHGGTNDAMVKVNKAFEVVSNDSLRQAYINQTGPFVANAT